MSPSPSSSPQSQVRQRINENREPYHPPRQVLDMVNGRFLDPSTALTIKGVTPRSTTYVGPRVIVSRTANTARDVIRLQEVARTLGWDAEVNPADLPPRPRDLARRKLTEQQVHELLAHEPDVPGVIRLELSVQDKQVTAAPDGWVLLQNARVTHGKRAMQRVGLDHVVLVRDVAGNPYHGSNPFPGSNPYHGSNPFPASDSVPISTYGVAGSGGRQPMMYAGPIPHRRPDDVIAGRRPVVATLDTGCGTHDWLVDVVRPGPGIDGRSIGYTDPATDPERWFDQVGALDGSIDELAGHGTFIAGLIHQACPDADIVAWRIVGSDGPIVESDLVRALGDIAELARRHRDGRADGLAIDVLNLSMGYYHETPQDVLFDPTIYDILRLLGECGVSVVCSAGNDATARPMYPAAFAPWRGRGGKRTETGVLPVISVGALNPNGTDALFSNTGRWVRAWAPGASVMSTLPPFQGGLQPAARKRVWKRTRESIDPDDYTGSFALWSGTSFAAPLFAGRVAAQLVDGIDPGRDGRGDAVGRGWAALTSLTGITP